MSKKSTGTRFTRKKCINHFVGPVVRIKKKQEENSRGVEEAIQGQSKEKCDAWNLKKNVKTISQVALVLF